MDAIIACIDSGRYGGHLLFGVTASGKTEVYLRCIERALALGKTSLVLLPEIALTTQVMNIFKSRFGDRVAVLHSALSAGERCDEWIRIDEGEAKVVLGARSAVFAPLPNIGLVIVDGARIQLQAGHPTALQRERDGHLSSKTLQCGFGPGQRDTVHRELLPCQAGDLQIAYDGQSSGAPPYAQGGSCGS